MTYFPEPKDPDEILTVSFDFVNLGGTPTNPSVSVAVRWGTEETPSLVMEGPPTVENDRVLQRFSGGADLHDYNLKCLADAPSGDRHAVDVVLAVRTVPIK